MPLPTSRFGSAFFLILKFPVDKVRAHMYNDGIFTLTGGIYARIICSSKRRIQHL